MQDNELDRILDGALSGYSDATPLAGLEQRVLNRIGIAERNRRWSHYFQVAVVLAALSSLVFVALSLRTPKTAPPVIAAVERPIPAVRQWQPVHAPVRTKRPPRRNVLPKQDQFPSPAPMTSEERSLLALVKRAPEMAQNASAEIEIPPIHVPPLQSDGSQ